MPYSVNIIRLLEKLDPNIREVLIAILGELERQREESVTKKEFIELKNVVKELVEAHKKAEERLSKIEQAVAELAEAQKKTEQKLNELAEAQKQTEKRVNELAEAQKKAEERLSRLEQTVAELAEAQKKTEQRLNELAEAQKQTETELRKLIGEHRKTREQLGGLQHTVGYILEDRAYVGLPPLLEKDLGLKITVPLKRDYIEPSPGQYIEVNIIGKGSRNGEEYFIIGECKTQLKKRDVDQFIKNLSRIKEILGENIIPVLVTYQTSPQVREYVKKKNINLYFSYQLPL